MENGSDFLAAVGELFLDFLTGLVRSLLLPLIQGFFGAPAAE